MADNETIASIIAEKRRLAEQIRNNLSTVLVRQWHQQAEIKSLEDEANRLEAAQKREVDNIHRAMVILAGIEMPDADYPPRLWTALEDAYNALSDALGTDGCTTSDEEEAKATGRHFVIQPRGDCAKLREALRKINSLCGIGVVEISSFEIGSICDAALAAPPRNCDVGTAEEQLERMDAAYCSKRLCAKGKCPLFKPGLDCSLIWAQMPYEEGGAK